MLCRNNLIPSRPNGSIITRQIKNATNVFTYFSDNTRYMFSHLKWSRFECLEKYRQEITKVALS